MSIQIVYVPVEPLGTFAREAFTAMGVGADKAAICAAALIHAEKRGHSSQGQGVKRLRKYFDQLSNGWIDENADFQVIKETPVLALADGHNGLGAVNAHLAMKLATRKAKEQGVGTVLLRNSTHFGSAGFHAREAVRADCIGLVFTNAGPELAPWGGMEPILGTNPWAIAAPSGGAFPLVLDMSLGMTGPEALRWMVELGSDLPLGWALTPAGEETNDPSAARNGVPMPFAQYKGAGLSMMTDVLTGVLGGGAFGLQLYSNPAHQDVSQFFLALDIEWFLPLEEFRSRIDELVRQVKQSKLRPGFEEILVAGEIDYRREQACLREGAMLEVEVFDDLVDLAQALEIAFPFERDVTEVGVVT